MNADPKHWTLRFDGTGFQLRETARTAQPGSEHRVMEQGLETILFHWGSELLPAPRLQMLSCSGALVREQDLLAVDGLGRIHIFELKKDTANALSLFQLVSYLTGRPRDDELWTRKSIVQTLWYGEQSQACRLAGLVARHDAEKVRTDKSRRVAGVVPHVERLDARLSRLTHLANQRTGLNLTPDMFRQISRSLLEQEFGGQWMEPIEEPTQVLKRIAGSRLSPHWQLGMTEAGIIVWTIAPYVHGALKAAEPLIERYLEIRCVSVDVREAIPGIEWSIAVAEPEDHAQNWAMADAFCHLMQVVHDRHLDEHPSAADRVCLEFPSASLPWGTGKRWASLGWQAAGGAKVSFQIWEDHIVYDLYNHGWTDGLALEKRQSILQLCKRLRKAHPNHWPWSSQEPGGDRNLRFVEAAVRLVNDYWQGLEELGAFKVDEWAYWMPPD